MDLYTLVIILTFFGFVALAAALLIPVYLFLKREEQVSKHWTPEQLARRLEPPPSPSDGTPEEEPSRPCSTAP